MLEQNLPKLKHLIVALVAIPAVAATANIPKKYFPLAKKLIF